MPIDWELHEVCNNYYILGLRFTEVNVAINIKVETLFRGANIFREGGREIAQGGGYISSWGEEIFPPPGDSVMGKTLFRDTGSDFLAIKRETT